MASMTDYLEEKAIQESAFINKSNDDDSEEAIAQSVLESYIAMTAAFTNVECMLEHATIATFCKEAEIEIPDIVQEGAWDTIKNIFTEIGEWFKNLLRGFMGLFSSSKLQKLIAKLKQTNTSESIKLDSDISLMVFHTENLFACLEGFKKKYIDNPDQADIKEINTEIDVLEKMLAPEEWKNGAYKNTLTSLSHATMKAGIKEDANELTVAQLIEVLEKINKFNIPKQGDALLRSLKFDTKKYIEKDKNGDNKENDPIDKDLVAAIKKHARLIAKAYDKVTAGLIKVTDKAYKDIEIEDKDQFKKDLTDIKKEKNSVKYNADESSENRPLKSDAYFA